MKNIIIGFLIGFMLLFFISATISNEVGTYETCIIPSNSITSYYVCITNTKTGEVKIFDHYWDKFVLYKKLSWYTE